MTVMKQEHYGNNFPPSKDLKTNKKFNQGGSYEFPPKRFSSHQKRIIINSAR